MKVFELDPKEKDSFRKQFSDGSKCGQKKTPILIQEFNNPRMINTTHFILLRTYMLVASTNPTIVYYHDGFWTVLPKIEIRNEARMKYNSFEDLYEQYPQFTYDRLEKIYNGNRNQSASNETRELEMNFWLDKFFRTDVQKSMIHLVKMNDKNFLKHSGVFELFGLDFIMGEGGKLYLIDVRASPKFLFKNQVMTKYYGQLFKDLFEIQYAYLRSRVKRVRTLLPKIHATIAKDKAIEFSSMKKDFEKFNQNNKIEDEFSFNTTANSFKLIYDKSLGKKGSFGLLPEECL